MTELAKTFEPGAIEARWYQHWESEGLFRPDRPDAIPYTIVMPPPNVTGSLHIGHALDNTLQDILIRRARMDGKDALWVVGTDHAGIATQMVVERNLALDQHKRTDFSRDEFVAKVWEWKAESGGQITQQLRRLGASCDWANERFTMDEGFSRAVTRVFVELHQRGLLYRDKRLVNWDPHFQTAISDLEVETREVAGKFWTLRYPLADGSGSVEVATTRPETMLADMAVAVHPDDKRYAKRVGQLIRLPITGREIPIITDEHADPELGSGAVKITPGHDFNDFEVGKRAGFKPAAMLNMLDQYGRVCQTADNLIPADFFTEVEGDVEVIFGSGSASPESVERSEKSERIRVKGTRGLDRFDARKKVIELLEKEGALVKVEDRSIATPYGDRSGVVIEPWLTDQWYVDAATLAKPTIAAVRSGDIEVVPETWKKTWFNWLENIQPWCVSRQLWWGHRIPAWYGPIADEHGVATSFANKIFVAVNEEQLLDQAKDYYGATVGVTLMNSRSEAFVHPWGVGDFPNQAVLFRDEDVLDTWFSSALWPFATLGWPDETADLARHYPNDVLISGFDIIFFWDARMAMQGFEFMGERPWKTLYLHGLVRDAAGQKMSKSKGNTVDPLGLIDRYGADALRFTMAAMESQGRDIKLDEKRVEGYRNFATKLWNAARFLQGNGIRASQSIAAPEAKLPVNRWIIGEVVETLAKLNKAFDELRFDGMADAIYHFTWGTFCDWYVELIKGDLSSQGAPPRTGSGAVEASSDTLRQAQGEREGRAAETRAVAAWAFDQILVMLHPFMPFVTEELWHAMGERERDLIVSEWPEPKVVVDRLAKAEMEWLVRLVDRLRTLRAEVSVPPGAKLTVFVLAENTVAGSKRAKHYPSTLIERFDRHRLAIARMARVDVVMFANTGMRFELGTGQRESRLIDRPMLNTGITFSVDDDEYFLILEGAIDLGAERARLRKLFELAAKDRDSLAARLANPAFTERAKPEAVDKARADHDARAAEVQRLSAALTRLG
ncbi:MAG: valine--tRNA ligase [Pseudomonadota bacterium]